MTTPSKPIDTGGPALTKKELLGESWTIDELCDAKEAWSAVCAGEDAELYIDAMRQLEKRGLVENIIEGPKRGRNAGRYEYTFTPKLEQLCAAMIAERNK